MQSIVDSLLLTKQAQILTRRELTLTEEVRTSARPPQEIFGQALGTWRQRAAWSQTQLAAALGVHSSYLSHLEHGKKRPSSQFLLRLCDTLHRRVPDWTVPQAVDGLQPLGITWETVAQWLETDELGLRNLQPLRQWWHAGRPTPPPLTIPPPPHVPLLYVERTIQPVIARRLRGWMKYQEVRYRAHILWGLGGRGKTTLAQALVGQPQTRTGFREGIFWLDAARGAPAEWAATLAQDAGLRRRAGEDWVARWQRWTAVPQHRALVIMDALPAAKDLQPVLGRWGPQMVLLITTQQPDAVWLAVRQWLPAATIQEYQVPGLQAPELRRLAQHIWQRDPTRAELTRLRSLGAAWGRAPDILSTALADAQRYGWATAEQNLRQRGGSAAERAVRQHLRRLRRSDTVAWQAVSALAQESQGPRPFSPVFAALVWETSLAHATQRLAQLNRRGVLERCPGSGLDPREPATWWTLAPLVRRVLPGQRPAPPLPPRVRLWRYWQLSRHEPQLQGWQAIWLAVRAYLRPAALPPELTPPPGGRLPQSRHASAAESHPPATTQELLWLQASGRFLLSTLLKMSVGGVAIWAILRWPLLAPIWRYMRDLRVGWLVPHCAFCLLWCALLTLLFIGQLVSCGAQRTQPPTVHKAPADRAEQHQDEGR